MILIRLRSIVGVRGHWTLCDTCVSDVELFLCPQRSDGGGADVLKLAGSGARQQRGERGVGGPLQGSPDVIYWMNPRWVRAEPQSSVHQYSPVRQVRWNLHDPSLTSVGGRGHTTDINN